MGRTYPRKRVKGQTQEDVDPEPDMIYNEEKSEGSDIGLQQHKVDYPLPGTFLLIYSIYMIFQRSCLWFWTFVQTKCT